MIFKVHLGTIDTIFVSAFLLWITVCPGVHSQIVVTTNHEEITVKQGDEAELVCSSEFEALGCSFRNPHETAYNLVKGAK